MQNNSIQGNGYYPEMVDKAFVAKKQNAKKAKPENFVYYVILAVEVVLIVFLMIVNVVVGANRKKDTRYGGTERIVVDFCNGHESKEDILSFAEGASKEEAISVVEQLNTGNGCTPEGLIPEKLKVRSDELSYQILFSYADVNEVPSIAKNSILGTGEITVDDFMIDETTDEYTIISVDPSKVDCEKMACYRGISFEKSHLDYHEVSSEEGTKYEMVLGDMSSDFIKTVLGIVMDDDIQNRSSLFDYYFDDMDDKFVMTGVYFGMGIDAEKMGSATVDNIPYAVNVYEKKFSVDKTTKVLSLEEDSSKQMEDPTMFLVRSIALTDDEVINILAVVDGLSDEEVNVFRNQSIDEDYLSDAERLSARVSAICRGDYSEVYRSSDNAGIFECDGSKEIYAVTNPDRTELGYAGIGYASYLGTRNDEIAEQFFDDGFYLFQDYRQANVPLHLILLTESPSEAELVEWNIDVIYDYIKTLNEQNETDINLTIFYTDDLEQVKELKDYVILSAAGGFLPKLPNGNGFERFYYYPESEPASLAMLAENPDLYSGQVRDAIKFRRHIEAEIDDGRGITKEALKQLLYDSFEAGL